MLILPIALAVALPVAAATGGDTPATPTPAELEAAIAALLPLHERIPPPGPMDWLAVHPEPGQTFRQYTHQHPTTRGARRRVLYVEPLGAFTPGQQRVLDATTAFVACFFGRPVRVRPVLPLRRVPATARRRHPATGAEQLHTGYLLHTLLAPQLPRDAATCLALTTADLWPGGGWNFVFGQAAPAKRVGVTSLCRYGDADATPAEFAKCRHRTLKTSVHETGHLLGMEHCTRHLCSLNGSNNLAEADRRPLWLCPDCMAKVCWSAGVQPVARFRALAAFCAGHDLPEPARYYQAAAAALAESP